MKSSAGVSRAARLRPVSGRAPRVELSRARAALRNMAKARVLIVGDLMLDEFVWGTVNRISPEAPVPVVWVNAESVMPGGAANVANNVRALNGSAGLVGVIGEDHYGQRLLAELRRRRVSTSAIVADSQRPTTLKTRVVAHHQQVVRIDREANHRLSGALRDRLLDKIRRAARQADAVIIEDYGKGVVTPEIIEGALSAAGRSGCVVTVDPKEEHIDYYRGVTAITPNQREAEHMSGLPGGNDERVCRIGQALLDRIQCRMVLVTRGEDGMSLFEQGGRQTHIPTMAQEVYDVSGAGDTVIAAFTMGLAAGVDPILAAYLANCAAGVVVGKVGVAVATPEEILAALKKRQET